MELFASAALSLFTSSPEASNDTTHSSVLTKRSPGSPDVQFLSLSLRLCAIRAMNYCRGLGETKTDTSYKQRPLNTLKNSFIDICSSSDQQEVQLTVFLHVELLSVVMCVCGFVCV